MLLTKKGNYSTGDGTNISTGHSSTFLSQQNDCNRLEDGMSQVPVTFSNVGMDMILHRGERVFHI